MTVLVSVILQNAHQLSAILMRVILSNDILQCLFCSEVILQNALLLSAILFFILLNDILKCLFCSEVILMSSAILMLVILLDVAAPKKLWKARL
jgi:hypothetical protein